MNLPDPSIDQSSFIDELFQLYEKYPNVYALLFKDAHASENFELLNILAFVENQSLSKNSKP